MPKKRDPRLKRAGVRGFNKPKRNTGSSKHKIEVLAKKGNEVKVVKFGHKDYGHNYSSKARKSYLARSAGIKNNSTALRSICLKNLCPRPFPSAAPSIIPGKSAIQKERLSRYSTMPN